MTSNLHAVKMRANKSLSPCVARMSDGTYDWFPHGHPLGRYVGSQFVEDKEAVVVLRWNGFAKKWVEVE